MRKVRILAALGLLAAATAANAEISSTWTLTNDYDFRGASQSATDPAVQASIDYAHESGFYVGAWASNVDFGPADIDYEVDLYAGFSGGAEDGLGWDVGIVYYTYPDESDANWTTSIRAPRNHSSGSSEKKRSPTLRGSSWPFAGDVMYIRR